MTCGWNDQRKVEADPWVEGGRILSVGWNRVNLSAMRPVSRRGAVLDEGHFCGGWAGTCGIRPTRRWSGWWGGNSVSLISVMFVKSYWSASCASCPWWFDHMMGAWWGWSLMPGQSEGFVTAESVLFERILPLPVFFFSPSLLPILVPFVRVSSDCAPPCRSLSSGWCRPRPSRRCGLAHALPSGSPGE